MKKVVLSLLLLMLSLTVVLTPEVRAADELKIWVNPGSETEWLEKVADNYQQKTGTKINITSISELNQAQKLSLDGPAGKGADIVSWPHDKIGKTVEQGLIEPISKYLPEDYAKKHFLSKSVRALTYKGKLYGLPFSYQSLALIYNKDKYSEIPATFNEFIKKAKKMTNYNQNQYGILFNPKDFYFTAPFLQGFGGYVFGQNADGSYDIEDLGLNTEGGIRGVKYLRRFKTENLIPKGAGDTVNSLFMEGSCGAVINGPWVISDYQEAGIDFGVVPLPKLPNDRRPQTFIGVKGYYVSTFSEHKQAAADFIKFLTDAKRSMDHYKSNNIIVPHKKVARSSQMKNDPLLNGFLKQARSSGAPMPNNPEMSQVWNPAANAVTFVLTGRAKPKQAMKMAEQMIKEGIQMMNR